MKHMVFLVFAALLAPFALAGDAKQCMQAGEQLKPFDVVDVTGKFKNDPKVCYV